jgi:GH25 family lysozyme M1 (1,4-beta-N-acetylmuramidase)
MPGRFADLSSFNPDSDINWPDYVKWSAQDDGISRVSLRVDQGVGVPDSAFLLHYNNAMKAGVQQFCFYHFAYPALHPDYAGAEAEVRSFLGYLGNRLRPSDVVMLDWEPYTPPGGAEQTGPADWAWTWLHIASGFAQISNARTWIYADPSYIASNGQDPRLASFPVMLARWTAAPPTTAPAPPHPFSILAGVQWTDKGVVGGISETVDADIYELPGVLLAPPAPPPPPPGPTPPDLAAVKSNILAAVGSLNTALAQLG